jgi:hypothetical protein
VLRHRTYLRQSLCRGSRHNREQGIVIALVAAFMLVVIGAMMALSIDVVTFYTARSEAQLAADSAALAGARVLANSGITTDPGGAVVAADNLAANVATQVAEQNLVGGALLTAANVVSVVFGGSDSNPTITVSIQKTDLPTFFARILGTRFVTVAARATAEAYNPSLPVGALGRTGPPAAPLCVKPWLLPNLDPTQTTVTTIFDPITGLITNPGLAGQSWGPSTTPPSPNPDGLYALCQDCSGSIATPAPGRYYPGAIDAADFPAPTQALPTCSAGFDSYQLAVAGCVQRPISCGPAATATINIDVTTTYATNRDANTVAAAGCLIHDNVLGGVAGDSDSIDTATTVPPFQFLAGNQNPVASAVGKDVMVSDSLVTIPVIDVTTTTPTTPSVTVIGFLQVFLNPSALTTLPYAGASPNEIPATIINMAGCGTSATGQPILGNGASPVAVRLITAP